MKRQFLPLFACFLFLVEIFNSLIIPFDKALAQPLLISSTNIAIVQFGPLPSKAAWKYSANERVFTNELFSLEPKNLFSKGYFIPQEYINIINSAFQQKAQIEGLKLCIVPDIGNLESCTPEIVVFGIVERASSDKGAILVIKVSVLNTQSLKKVTSTLQTQFDKVEIPYIVESPIHTIGNHGGNFHPQRNMIFLAALDCASQLFALIKKEMGYAGEFSNDKK
ncbi:MAG: hypothetical protein HQK78_17900 [Desulfobacterales bacterium]|nr:hypothetical protein [Desulfobacterales bacterium]